MKRLILFTLAIGALSIASCKKDDPQLGDAPTEADAQFTYEVSSESDNIIIFTALNSELTAQWDLGNGSTAEGTTVEGLYPQAGEYTVVLTVFNSGGSASSSQTITIEQDDPTLLDDPIYNILTGGGTGSGSRTWVIDSNIDAHFGVGPNPSGAAGDYPEWYAAVCNEKQGAGYYNDRFTFHLNGFKFDQVTNGQVYVNTEQAGNFAGSEETNVGDYRAPYEDRIGETWSVTIDEDTTLSISGDAFIGYYSGVREYKIVRITENELFIRMTDAANPELAWYQRLIPEGYDSGSDCETGGGGGGGTGYALPIDFETEEPDFEAFGGSTDTIIDNPYPTGINTSNRVLETVHGNETWAGIFVDLEDPLDFSTNTNITVKLYAPSTGTMRFKIESQANSNTFVEKDVTVSTANDWVEVTVDFSGEAADTYDRLVFFPGWDVANAGTFYLDDIVQE